MADRRPFYDHVISLTRAHADPEACASGLQGLPCEPCKMAHQWDAVIDTAVRRERERIITKLDGMELGAFFAAAIRDSA